MKASGATGQLRVGYQRAADVGAWSLDVNGRPLRFVVNAEIIRVDQFWITQSPMTLELYIGSARWSWERVTPAIERDRLMVRVEGRPIITKGEQHG